ncbi:hypothetical protein STEG23_005416, partial [Scotinomys teguina]
KCQHGFHVTVPLYFPICSDEGFPFPYIFIQHHVLSFIPMVTAVLTRICNEKEQAKQGKIQNVQLEEKRSTRKCEQIKEKADAKWNKGSGDLRPLENSVSYLLQEKNEAKYTLRRSTSYMAGMTTFDIFTTVIHHSEAAVPFVSEPGNNLDARQLTNGLRKCGTYTQMEYYSAEKNNNIMKFAGKWMELENLILSEVTQTQKDKHVTSVPDGADTQQGKKDCY